MDGREEDEQHNAEAFGALGIAVVAILTAIAVVGFGVWRLAAHFGWLP